MLLFFPAAPLGKEKDIDEGKSRGDSMAQMLLSLFYISRIFQNLKFLYVMFLLVIITKILFCWEKMNKRGSLMKRIFTVNVKHLNIRFSETILFFFSNFSL